MVAVLFHDRGSLLKSCGVNDSSMEVILDIIMDAIVEIILELASIHMCNGIEASHAFTYKVRADLSSTEVNSIPRLSSCGA